MNQNQFKKLLREFYALTEADVPENLKDTSDKGSVSLDDQVDKLFVGYEKDAREIKTEGHDFRSLTRKFLIEADDEGETADASTEEPEAAEAPKSTADDIDVNAFAQSVVRLIDNYDSLLDVRDTIVRRAQQFLSKNYDESAVSDFKSVMRDTFDIEPGTFDLEKEDKYQPPPAQRAGKGTE